MQFLGKHLFIGHTFYDQYSQHCPSTHLRKPNLMGDSQESSPTHDYILIKFSPGESLNTALGMKIFFVGTSI